MDGQKTQTRAVTQVSLPPLVDDKLIGATHVSMPLSTLELFLRRFDLLEMQLKELKSIGSRGPALHSASNAHADADTAVYNESAMELPMRVSALGRIYINKTH